MRPKGEGYKRHTGFTLVELVIVIVLLAVIAVYAAMRNVSPAETTLPSQAEKLARDIRHLQMLSITWGKSLRLNVTPGINGSYNVSCVTSEPAAPCNVSPVIDPATGGGFSVVLQKDVVLGGPASKDFDSLGRPVTGGAVVGTSSTYTLTANTTSMSVTVSPITGFVAVTTP